MDDKDIEVRFSTKNLPFEYKLLEYRLIINKGLYDEKIINQSCCSFLCSMP